MTISPITPEALADLHHAFDLDLSPDGATVAYCVAPLGRKEEHPRHAIWIAREDAAPRQFTGGTHADASPRWSPSGDRLLFLSDRAKPGESQSLYLLPLDGGEALPLGDLSGDLSSPCWSPDGSMIALLVTDAPDADRKKRKDDRDDRVVVEDEHLFSRVWVVDASSGKARCLTTGDREMRSVRWLSDGTSLIATSTSFPGWDEYFSDTTIWQIPLSGGLPRKITEFPLASHDPVVVGDAAYVASAIGRDDPVTSIWEVDLQSGNRRKLLPEWEPEVMQIFALPADPSSLIVHAVNRVHGSIFRVTIATGQIEEILPADLLGRGSVRSASVSRDGRRIACVWSDSSMPEELYLGETRGRSKVLTSFGETCKDHLAPGEVVRWASTDGVEIEGLLITPRDHPPGTRVPLVVDIHGGPSWQWEDRVMLNWHDWAQMLAAKGIATLLPNPRGSTAYGAKFQQLLQDDVGGGEAQDLISGALAMVERGIADPDRLGIGGWSWGGYLTARTITKTSIFKAAVMGAGLANVVSDHGSGDIPRANLQYFPGHPYHHMDHYWQASPIREVSSVTTPTLILHGDIDARVHPAQGAEFFRALKTLGVPVEFVRYPREGHGIRERLHQIDLMRRVTAWYERYLLA